MNDGTPSYNPGDEAGAEDNRISVNPNDPQWKDDIGSWKDGSEYPIPTGTMKQISPGEFAIVKASFKAAPVEEETPTEEAAPTEEAEPSPGEAENMGSMSPAAAAVMARRKAM